MAFTIVTWNMRRATAHSPAWQIVRQLNPHVALLQEVISIPQDISSQFSMLSKVCVGPSGRKSFFRTVILARGGRLSERALRAELDWANRELSALDGAAVAGDFSDAKGSVLLVNVHSPAWPVSPERLNSEQLDGIKLTLNSDVWGADLVLAALRTCDTGKPVIVAGDFNLSETFDLWPGGPRGNREYLDRMEALGLFDCLRIAQGGLTPTFRNVRGGAVKHQMDHLFVTPPLLTRLESCETWDETRIFGSGLSDHLPVVATFSCR